MINLFTFIRCLATLAT